MGSPLTLKELAALLHLAPSTVSRALKGHPDISYATQEKVRQLAERMHYRPNAIARGLRKKHTYLIAILVPSLRDDFFARTVSRIIQLNELQAYKTIVFESREDAKREAEICDLLEKSGIEGLLAAPGPLLQDAMPFEQLQSAGIPVVIFEHFAGNLHSDQVVGDHYRGAYEAVSHLIENGCRRIAHLSGTQNEVWSQKKQLGYKQALTAHHLSGWTEVYRPEKLRETVKKWIREAEIDGIFTAEDKPALEIAGILREQGYEVPGEIALCGYGNHPAGIYTSPSLSSVDGNPEEIAANALELLWKRISGKASPHPETRIIQNRLIIRESSQKILFSGKRTSGKKG